MFQYVKSTLCHCSSHFQRASECEVDKRENGQRVKDAPLPRQESQAVLLLAMHQFELNTRQKGSLKDQQQMCREKSSEKRKHAAASYAGRCRSQYGLCLTLGAGGEGELRLLAPCCFTLRLLEADEAEELLAAAAPVSG